MPPRGSPTSSVLPRRPGVALSSRALPVHARIGRRLDHRAPSGLADRRDRFAPLGATGSSWVFHLATVADSLRPARGAGSWFRLENRARCMRRDPRRAPSRPARPRGRLGPNPPSIGERLLLTLIVGACCQRTDDLSHRACHARRCARHAFDASRDPVVPTGLASDRAGRGCESPRPTRGGCGNPNARSRVERR